MTDKTPTPDWGDDARNHPIVTKNDWKMWTDEDHFEKKQYPAQSRSQQRRGQRERFYNALLDLCIIFEHMETEQREKVYEKLSGADAADGPLQLDEIAPKSFEVLTALAGIFYEATTSIGVPMNSPFADGVRSVVDQSAKHLPPGATMRVSAPQPDIEIVREEDMYLQIDSAIRKLEAGGRLGDLDHGELLNYSRAARQVESFDTEAVAKQRREQIEEIESQREEVGEDADE